MVGGERFGRYSFIGLPARTLLRAFRPKPWSTDRAAAAAEIDRLQVGANAYVVWLSDGLQDDGADKLTERLSGAIDSLRGRGRLTEDNIADTLRQVRMALLEADVNYQVAQDFTERVSQAAVGTEVLKSLNPYQQFVGIVHHELVNLMGPVDHSLGLRRGELIGIDAISAWWEVVDRRDGRPGRRAGGGGSWDSAGRRSSCGSSAGRLRPPRRRPRRPRPPSARTRRAG